MRTELRIEPVHSASGALPGMLIPSDETVAGMNNFMERQCRLLAHCTGCMWRLLNQAAANRCAMAWRPGHRVGMEYATNKPNLQLGGKIRSRG